MEFDYDKDLAFLQLIDPPQSFPPQEQELVSQIQDKFISQCQRFLKNEKELYKCGKVVENRIKAILKNSNVLKNSLSTQKNIFEHIHHELNKNRAQKKQLENKQQILAMLCQMVRMETMREQLLLEDDKFQKYSDKEEHTTHPIVDQSKYLASMQKLQDILKQSEDLKNLQTEFPLIVQILRELETIFNEAVKKVLKKLLTPRMFQLILMSHFNLFLQSPEHTKEFDTAMIGNRLQHLKISLNPMLNNLNYANNVSEMHELIFKKWIEIIKEDLYYFSRCDRKNIVKEVTLMMMAEAMPKMQKNIYRVKQMTEAIIIRKNLHFFLQQILSVSEWNDEKQSLDLKKKRWEPIPSMLSKCLILIETKLTEQSDQLESTKYNIYSLASYIPVREHLQKIKVCFQNQIQGEQVDWQSGFYNLSLSRNAKNYPNNKSLIIFNLNIWYLHLKIIKHGKHEAQGREIMKWCQETLTRLNVREVHKAYYDSFQKVLELCGNLPAFKGALYAEVNLLGHEQLRRAIAAEIRQKFMQVYTKMLQKVQAKSMNNSEVKQFCQKKKINLNKFGKFSNSICIYSLEKLYQLIKLQ